MEPNNHHHQSAHRNDNHAVEHVEETVQHEDADKAMQSKRSLQDRILQTESMRSPAMTSTAPRTEKKEKGQEEEELNATASEMLAIMKPLSSSPIKSPKSPTGICKKQRTKSRSSSSKRCAKCRTKLGLMAAVPCKCEKTFCSLCRYPEDHGCTFDYRAEQKEHLRKDLTRVVAKKVNDL